MLKQTSNSSEFELTLETKKRESSNPQPRLIVKRMKTRIAEDVRVIVSPKAAAMMIHARWSVGVIAAKGGDCPGGT